MTHPSRTLSLTTILGCGLDNEGKHVYAIVGLGLDLLSLVSQLAVKTGIEHMFSYCALYHGEMCPSRLRVTKTKVAPNRALVFIPMKVENSATL